MKTQLRKAFSPILDIFESGDGEFRYKPSYRTILLAVGALFLLLSLVSLTAAIHTGQFGAWVPFIVF